MKKFLEKLVKQKNLSIEEMKEATKKCLHEATSTNEVAAFLTALRTKGETAKEISGLVDVIRSYAKINFTPNYTMMDNCGTGGDYSNSFNISTTAAFVIAGAGVKVAKHGNHSSSSKTGSADVLKHLGVPFLLTTEEVEQLLKVNNIAFLYAPHIHDAFKKFIPIRQNLKIPTIFNAIGPLTNPLDLKSQLIGVYDKELMPKMIHVLKHLNRKRAVIIHGAEGMDEFSLAGTNKLLLLENDTVKQLTIHPKDLGLPIYSIDAIQGSNAEENARILKSVLKGISGPYYDTTIANAAVGLFAHGTVKTVQEGLTLAEKSIQSGKALEQLNRLINFKSTMCEVT